MLPTLADLRQFSTGERGKVGGWAGDEARDDKRAAAIPDRFSDQKLHSSLDLQGELVLAVKTFIDGNPAGRELRADWAELYPSFRRRFRLQQDWLRMKSGPEEADKISTPLRVPAKVLPVADAEISSPV